MKILILGSDGYIGHPLTLHLLKKGHEVSGVDNLSRRRRVEEIGGNSLTPIDTSIERKSYLRLKYKNYVSEVDMTLGMDGAGYIESILRSLNPDCIVHLAEQPSAPWSMRSAGFAKATQLENVLGTLDLLWAMKKVCPKTHLVKIGTMGEYGTPNCDIPEGFIPKTCINSGNDSPWCSMEGLLFPRSPGSFYHLSKVHDTYNIKFACDTWGLRSTDIMQGVVFGLGHEPVGGIPKEELTRFDYDEYFGTVINRFCAQAIVEHPLTIYGDGFQQRGFLPLKDSVLCLTIAIECPPAKGEYRTWNQFENIYSINKLASMVIKAGETLKLRPYANHIDNPRTEAEDHYYNPTCQTLLDMGYIPTKNIQSEITSLIRQLLPFKDRIIEEVIMPKTTWE